ncbi:MAG: hypothetical protein AAGM84_05655 [Pseudomonadota bacterium]
MTEPLDRFDDQQTLLDSPYERHVMHVITADHVFDEIPRWIEADMDGSATLLDKFGNPLTRNLKSGQTVYGRISGVRIAGSTANMRIVLHY